MDFNGHDCRYYKNRQYLPSVYLHELSLRRSNKGHEACRQADAGSRPDSLSDLALFFTSRITLA